MTTEAEHGTSKVRLRRKIGEGLRRSHPLERVVREGEMIPRGYGLAYRDFATNHLIAYPVPLNWLVRASRGLRYKLKVPRGGWEKELQQITRKAHDEGRGDALIGFMNDLQPTVEKAVREQLRKQHHARRSQLSDWVTAARELLRDAPGPRSTSDERQAWESRRQELLGALAAQHPEVQQAASAAEFLPDQTEMRDGVYLKPTGSHADNPFTTPLSSLTDEEIAQENREWEAGEQLDAAPEA